MASGKGENARQEVLRFVRQFHQDQGTPPTIRDIVTGTSLSSLSTVHGHIVALETQGVIERKGPRWYPEDPDLEFCEIAVGRTLPQVIEFLKRQAAVVPE